VIRQRVEPRQRKEHRSDVPRQLGVPEQLGQHDRWQTGLVIGEGALDEFDVVIAARGAR
jgi:hypothetical protein